MSIEPTLFNADDPRLTAYALGELTDPAERAQVEQFLAASPEARAEVADIRAVTAALTAEYEQERAAATVEALPSNVVSLPAAAPRSRMARMAPWLALAAVLLIAVVVAGISLPVYNSLQVRGGNPPLAAAVPEPEKRTTDDGPVSLAAIPAPAATPAASAPLLAANKEPQPPMDDQKARERMKAAEIIDHSTDQVEERELVVPPGQPLPTNLPPGTTAVYGPAPQIGVVGGNPAAVVSGPLLAQQAPPAAFAKRTPTLRGDSAARRAMPQAAPAMPAPASKPLVARAFSSVAATAPAPPPAEFDGSVSYDKSYKQDAANTADYAHAAENPFLAAKENPLSTFSADVDTASYAIVRRFIEAGSLPPPDAVRVEEMLNYFPYADAPPAPGSDKPFAIHLEAAACPWNPAHRLVRIGLKAKEIDTDQRPASNLVFLLDVSGSMMPEERLPLIKRSLRLLVDQLREDDHVAIVVYAGESGLALSSTSGDHKDAILRAIDQLHAGGSTNGAAGIKLAYDVARKGFIKEGTNRVILATDGDFNVGVTSRGALLRLVEEQRKSGVFLSVLGVGTDNLKDATMQTLADHGNGNYHYLDRLEEGRKVLVQQMSGTLVTVAKDVKIQVEFNPAVVASYRLVGYEKRLLRKEDFNDDRIDAGEIGAGHHVTALYEVVPVGQPGGDGPVDALKYQQPPTPDVRPTVIPNTRQTALPEMLTVKLRHKAPDSDRSERSYEEPLIDRGAPGDYANASDDFRFAAAVASFGLVLRDSPHKGDATLGSALELAQGAKGEDPNGYRAGFIELVRQAQALERAHRR